VQQVRILRTSAFCLALLATAGATSRGTVTPSRGVVTPSAAKPAQTPDPFGVLEAAGKVYRGSSGICADFQQTLVVPLLGQDVKGRGKLCTRPPGLFSMRFTEPKGDVYLADGTSLWMYRPSADAKQVIKLALASGPRGVDFYSDFLDSPRSKYKAEYRGKPTVDGKAMHQIALTPLQKTSYRSAVLWIGAQDSLLRKVEITEENGSVRTVTLASIVLGPKLAADAFRFTPPAGAQVISR
jgi:outer membrane lipoprotein carrier protein